MYNKITEEEKKQQQQQQLAKIIMNSNLYIQHYIQFCYTADIRVCD